MAAAALELFDAHGYDAVSAAQIAAHAGVTERTFFRHFDTKREALFSGEAILRDALGAAMDTVPPAIGPLDAALRAIHSLTSLLEGNRAFAKPRHHLIERTPALLERELAKMANLTGILAERLGERGVRNPEAAMAAQAAMAIFWQANIAWLADDTKDLDHHLVRAAAAMKSVVLGDDGPSVN